jgi:uncharacterized protein
MYELIIVSGFLMFFSCQKMEMPRFLTPVPFTAVHINDNFWAPKIEINRTVSIPSAFWHGE